MQYAPQIIDIILIIAVITAIVSAYKDGFLTSVINLAGNVAGLIIAWVVSNKYSPFIFQKFFSTKLTEKTFEYIQNSSNAIDAKELIQSLIGGLPQGLMDKFIQQSQNAAQGLETQTMEAAKVLVDTILGPIITLLIGIIMFVLILFIFKIVTAILAKTLKIVNHIPVVGFANRLGGACVGVVLGYINVILLSCFLSIIVIITQNTLSFLNMDILEQSKLLALTSSFNPFL